MRCRPPYPRTFPTQVGLALALLAGCSGERAAPPITVEIPGGAPATALEPAPEPSAGARARHPKEAPPIAWMTSEPEARERARRAGLPMIVYARAEWDAATLEMERVTWSDPRVRAAARPFVALRLDLTPAEGDAERYAEQYGVAAVPTTILFDAHGRRVDSIVGYQSADRIVEALGKAGE